MRETTTEILRNELTGDSYQIVHHKSGLDLLLCPMKDFLYSSAMLGVHYGSIHNCFKTSEDAEAVSVPDGIAHYLEHKLFENEDCDAFELFAKSGAEANAMTGMDMTAYFFECTENFYDSLRILLNTVRDPYFTQENVDKEQGIIAQEIRMTNDLPKRRCFRNMLTAMYTEHPIRIDTAGTEESIAKITPDLLYKCYHSFYDLHNMALSAAGNFETEKLIEVCDELLTPSEDKKLEVFFPDEPAEVGKKRVEEQFGLDMPVFFAGFKCRPWSGGERLRKETAAEFMILLLSGRMTPLYKKLKEENLILGGLAGEVFDGDGFFTVMFSGESEDPDRVIELLLEAVENARKNGFDEEVFEIYKKTEYGDVIRNMDHPEECSELMLFSHFSGTNMFEQARIISEMKIEEVYEMLDETFDTEKMSVSILR